jgi:hypothetical protein
MSRPRGIRARMKPRSMRPSPVIPLARPRPQQIAKSTLGNSRSGEAVAPSVVVTKPLLSTETPQQSVSSHKTEDRALHANPSKQVSSSTPFTPSVVPDSSVAEALYEVVVQEILSRASSAIRSKFERSRDPRLLFPFAPDGPKRKVLSDWLDAHYFIPKDLITPVPASKYVVGPDPRASDFVVSSGNIRDAPAASSSVPDKIVDANASTFGTKAEAFDSKRAPSAMKDLTNTLTSLRAPEAASGMPTRFYTKSPTGAEQWTAISPLLEVSRQTVPHDFDTFVSKFATEDIHAHYHRGGRKLPLNARNFTWRKIGEASFSEVFRVGEVVLKIVPLEYHELQPPTVSQSYCPKDERGRVRRKPRPSTSLPEDVLREINATRVMGGVHPGFTSLLW